MTLGGRGRWTIAPCVHEEVQLEPIPHPTPNTSSLELALAACCGFLLPGKFHPTSAMGQQPHGAQLQVPLAARSALACSAELPKR